MGALRKTRQRHTCGLGRRKFRPLRRRGHGTRSQGNKDSTASRATLSPPVQVVLLPKHPITLPAPFCSASPLLPVTAVRMLLAERSQYSTNGPSWPGVHFPFGCMAYGPPILADSAHGLRCLPSLVPTDSTRTGGLMSAEAPTCGDWFVVANEVSGLKAPEQGGVHPFIVKSSWPGPQVTLLPRSASRSDGLPHPAHGGECGYSTCRINRDGTIGPQPVSVPIGALTDFSCSEPDDDIVEWAMAVESTPPPTRGRR